MDGILWIKILGMEFLKNQAISMVFSLFFLRICVTFFLEIIIKQLLLVFFVQTLTHQYDFYMVNCNDIPLNSHAMILNWSGFVLTVTKKFLLSLSDF